MSSPPVSKQMPLPTSVTRGAPVLPQASVVDQARRARARPADRVDHGEILGLQVVADDAA